VANQRLTKRVVDAAECGERSDTFIWDTELRGFGLRVSTGGAKSYVFQYRMKGGTARRMTLGAHGSPWTTETARKEAERRLFQVRQGIDPAEETRRKAETAKRLADEAAKEAAQNLVLAFDAYADSFVELYLKTSWKDSWLDAERILNYAKKHFGTKLISEIKRTDVVKWLDTYSDRPAMKKLVHSVFRKMFNWAANRGDIDVSPIAGMKSPKGVPKRQRLLSHEELICAWLASKKISPFWGPYVRLMILTVQRREEVAGMDWSEIDLDQALWQLPSDRAKNDIPNRVPLNALAVAELESLGPKKSGLVFSSTGTTSASGFSKAKKKLDDEMLIIMIERAKMRGEAIENMDLIPWRMHDLRRTGATNLQALGVPVEVTEAVLNHISGSTGGVAGVYNLFRYDPQKRQALDAWSNHITLLLQGGQVTNILPFARYG